jgi:hypothetical protein
MNTGEENTPVADDNGASPLLSLDLELAPAWAKKSPEVHNRRYADDPRGGIDDSRRSGGDRDSRRSREGGGRGRPAPRGGPSSDFRRDRREGGGRPERGAPRPERNPFHSDLRRPDERRDFRPAREELPPLPLEVRVLPDQKALGAVIRKIQTSHRAYPLRDIARLFLDNDAAYQIRIEPANGETVPLFQCKVCNLPALSEEEIRTHVLAAHLGDFFDVAEIETEPPAGNFVCVARCGISGELLGPPNHHSYNTRVQEMLRTRFAHMSADAYRARIEMVRDPETVNQWRESCRKKTVYRRKRPPSAVIPEPTAPAPAGDAAAPAATEGAPAVAEELPLGPAMERAAAESVFQREILPEQILSVKHMVCPAAVVRRTPSPRLLECVRETMNRELRFPASLFFALRGAFRHRALHLFRANNERGPDFVVVRAPVTLDATHVVAELRQVLEYINQNQGCTRLELLTALAKDDEARAAHLATQINTLVEKAHVIEFYNGILCPPAAHPAFRYLPGEREGQRTDGRGQKAENQAPGARRQAAKGEAQRSEGKGQPTADNGQNPTVEAQTSAEPVAPPVTEPQPEIAAPADAPAATAEAEVQNPATESVAAAEVPATPAAESPAPVNLL